MIASLIPIFLLIDGPKTGLKLLHGQVEAENRAQVTSRASLGKPIVPIVVE